MNERYILYDKIEHFDEENMSYEAVNKLAMNYSF
jgi:hypothetical protein